MIRAYRISQIRYVATAFSGEGARLAGGRWNSPGQAVVYAASSLSLATLEVMAHLEDYRALRNLFAWAEMSFPESLLETLDDSLLPSGWDADQPTGASMSVGDQWRSAARSAALRVPSTITPGEYNYLFNPNHREFPEVHLGGFTPLRINPRLLPA